MSYRISNELVHLNKKVEDLLVENQRMVSSVKKLINEVDEYKKQCDAIRVVSLGASIFGSFLQTFANEHDQRQQNNFMKNTGEMAETLGNATNTGVKLFDNLRSKALLVEIQTMVQNYREKSQQIQSELAQYSSLDRRRNRMQVIEVRGNTSINFRQLGSIVENRNMRRIGDKTSEMFDLIQNSCESHPIVTKLEKLLRKLESDSERIVRIRDIISDSFTDPRTQLRRELLNRCDESDFDWDEYQELTFTQSNNVWQHN